MDLYRQMHRSTYRFHHHKTYNIPCRYQTDAVFRPFRRHTRKRNALYYYLVVLRQVDPLSWQPHCGGAAREEPLSPDDYITPAI